MNDRKRTITRLPAMLLIAALGAAPVQVQAQAPGGASGAPPPPPMTLPQEMREPAYRQSLPRPGMGDNAPLPVSSGCCEAPGPDGLHCCDTRDCGWFSCGDMAIPSKTYR